MIAGQKLQEFRVAQRVRPVDLAKAMAVPRQRIGQIEAQVEVGREVATRYMTGVCQASNIVGWGDQVELQVLVMANGEEIERW